MPQYIINPDGSRTIKSRYSRKGVRSLCDIFPNTPATSKKYLKRKKGSKGKLQDIYGLHDNSVLVRRIFGRFLIKVMERVLMGDIFIMSDYTKSNITVKTYSDKEVKALRQKGYFADYDIVGAGFKIPKISYDFGPYNRRRDVGVYVPKEMMQSLLKRAQNREIPYVFLPKTCDRDVQDD